MTLTITQGDRQTNSAWQSSESLTESTATTPQQLSNKVDISYLGMGTATGDNVNNLYTLLATSTETGRIGDAVEGQEKFILATATGEAAVFIDSISGRLPLGVSWVLIGGTTGTASDVTGAVASATGMYVFQANNDFCRLKFMNGNWWPQDAFGCTLSTGT